MKGNSHRGNSEHHRLDSPGVLSRTHSINWVFRPEEPHACQLVTFTNDTSKTSKTRGEKKMKGNKNPGTPHLARTWIKIKWLGLASLRQEAKQKKSFLLKRTQRPELQGPTKPSVWYYRPQKRNRNYCQCDI